MADNDWKQRLGVVFSTNPDFQYQSEEQATVETLPPARQKLRVGIDRRARAGKQVTLVSGFDGDEASLAALGTLLRKRLGVGGSAADGEILLQGDVRDKVVSLLKEMGHAAKRGN